MGIKVDQIINKSWELGWVRGWRLMVREKETEKLG
jgi:hypothetical protein